MIKNSIYILLIILVFTFLSCDRYEPPTYLSRSRIVFVDDDILVNTADNEIVRYNNSLEEISRIKITDECDQVELFEKKGDVFAYLMFNINGGILIKYDAENDTIAWKSDTIDACVHINEDILVINDTIFMYSSYKTYINRTTGELIEVSKNNKLDRSFIVNKKITQGYFSWWFNIYESDTIDLFVNNNIYTLTKDYIEYKTKQYNLKNSLEITAWYSGFVVRSKNEDRNIISIVDNKLNEIDSIIVDFSIPRFSVNNRYLIIRELFGGVEVYDLKNTSKYLLVSKKDGGAFIDAKIKGDKLYVLTRDDLLEYPLEFNCERNN